MDGEHVEKLCTFDFITMVWYLSPKLFLKHFSSFRFTYIIPDLVIKNWPFWKSNTSAGYKIICANQSMQTFSTCSTSKIIKKFKPCLLPDPFKKAIRNKTPCTKRPNYYYFLKVIICMSLSSSEIFSKIHYPRKRDSLIVSLIPGLHDIQETLQICWLQTVSGGLRWHGYYKSAE